MARSAPSSRSARRIDASAPAAAASREDVGTQTEKSAPKFSTRQRLTLLATGLGLFMIYLDATIVNVALPDIQDDFGGGEQGLQWVVAAYSLTMGMFIMSAASFADERGRRRVYVAGLGLFAFASALCGLAPNLFVLNLGRGLQGVGAAVVNVASLALVSAAFPDAKAKARAIGLWTGIASIGLAIGPTVGGVLTESLGWRSIFFVNVVIGIGGAVLARATVEESRDPTPRTFDVRGQILFIVAVGALTWGLIEGPHSGWLSPVIVGLLVGSVALLGAFVVAELRSSDPMMDVRVFRDRVYSVAIVTLFVELFVVYGMLLTVTQYLQNVEDYAPEQAGLVVMVFTLPLIVLSPLAGAMIGRFGARRLVLAGMSFSVVGLVIIAAGVGGWLGLLLIGLLVAGMAPALVLVPTTNIAMASIPPDRAGMASGILSAQRALGSTAGFAVMGSVLAAVVASTLPSRFASLLSEPQRSEAVSTVVEDANPRAVASLIGPGKPLRESIAAEARLVEAAGDSFIEGIRIALAVGAGFALVVLVAAFFVLPRGTRDAQVDQHEAVKLEKSKADS